MPAVRVAPLAGAWIEIPHYADLGAFPQSLPSRERGLKYGRGHICLKLLPVAPLAGAWIEMTQFLALSWAFIVAPLAGAWIEMLSIDRLYSILYVAPLAGAWIEITQKYPTSIISIQSLPSRERGLKF